MILVTSLSPKNSEYQKNAVLSWNGKYDIYSINHISEIEALKKEYPLIRFIEAKSTGHHLFARHLVPINEMLGFAIESNDDVLIINSDIILSEKIEFNFDGIGIGTRTDFDNTPNIGELFKNGFDFFVIPKKYQKTFPHSIHCMGACWWDYWVPYIAIKNRIKLKALPFVGFHKTHKINYHQSEWEYIAKYFQWENKLISFGNNFGRMGSHVLAQIKANIIK